MNENADRKIIERIACISGIISSLIFAFSSINAYASPYGVRSESALLAIGSAIIYTEIHILNVPNKVYKITILFYLTTSVLLRFVEEMMLVLSPIIFWGHIFLCVICLIWIFKEERVENKG